MKRAVYFLELPVKGMWTGGQIIILFKGLMKGNAQIAGIYEERNRIRFKVRADLKDMFQGQIESANWKLTKED